MSGKNIEDILSRATSDIRKLIEEAFEAGRNDMRRELLFMLSGNQVPSDDIAPRGETPELDATAAERVIGRAAIGTVKPAIKSLIENSRDGILTSEIITRTGFKENSVRGTLSALKAEGFAERHGDLWVLSVKKSPQASASGPS